MASPKEVGLRVEDFMGVNVQLASEDLQDYFYKKMQNLYERKIGELQPRGGSVNLTATTPPSSITKFDGGNYLKDKILGKTKIAKVYCTDQGNVPIDMTAKITVSFVSDVANGKWGNTSVGVTNGYIGGKAGAVSDIYLVGIGFGYCTLLNYTSGGGTVTSGDTKKLRVVISSSLANTNLTKIEVYCRTTFDPANSFSDYMYVGNIDIVNSPTGTTDFNNGPIGFAADPGVAQEVGTTDTVFTAAGVASGLGGTLTPGKTYYVAVLNQRLKYDPAAAATCKTYYQTTTITAVTIPSGGDAINVVKASGGSACSMIAIGLHPQCLIPTGITSNSSSFNLYIKDFPVNPVSVVNLARVDATTDKLYFKYTDIGRDEMFCKIVSNVWIPIPINNFNALNSDRRFVIETGLDVQPLPPFMSSLGPAKTITSDKKYTFTQYFNLTQDLLYGVGKQGTVNNPTVTGSISPTHNIVQCEGNVASMLVIKFGSASPPPASYISNFKERVLVGGGITDAYNRIYFSAITDSTNFGVPGAATTAQFVQVESGGEELNGIGLYTNTSGTGGPVSQLLIGKQNSIWLLTDLPVYTSGSLNNAVMTVLTRKFGCANHDTIVNTEIGTIMSSRDNVLLIRDTGEPIPLGHEISYFLRPQDPSVLVDTSYWSACVHDNRYKLSFSVSGSAVPSQELWLNIAKMKQMKGQPCWEGPHLGREVKFSFTEEQFLDNIIPKRICIDSTNKRWYAADREDTTTDFGSDAAYILETRDYPMGDPNFNKLYTACNWRMKVDQAFNFTESSIVLDENGEETLAETRAVAPVTGYSGGTYALFLNCRAKIYAFFHSSRIRGETIRKKWSYTGHVFFAISGFTIFYEPERRRSGV